ncbi:MAG: TetR/AcrR family transcriptional regulator [Baekduiaceae bacterium]
MTKRQQRQQETRAALLDAAETCFAARGYDAVSVPEIAKEAGYTTGAVYSNFSGKEELFLALMERAMGGQAARREEVVALEDTGEGRLRQVARLWIDVVHERPEAVVLIIEFWSYSRRDPALRKRFAERMAQTRAGLAALAAMAPPARADAAPPEEVAMAAYAMAHGLAIHHIADPEGVPIEVVESALLWVFRGAGHLPD